MKLNKSDFLDLLYLVAIFALLNLYYFLHKASVSYYDLIIAVFFVTIGILLLFGSLLGKVIASLFLILLFYYLEYTLINVFVLIITVLLLLFCVFYFKNEKQGIQFKYRLICLFCFFIAYNCSLSYHDRIDSEDDRYGYNLTHSNYYYYHHPQNYEEFVARFGRMAFLEKKAKDDYAEILDKKNYMYEISSFINRKREKGTENAYSGIFEGKNLIIIQADFLYECLVSEEMTPYIAMIRDESIHIDGFDNQITKYGKPDAEFILNLSLFPSGQDGCDSYLYDEGSYQETLASLFNRAGYRTMMLINDYDVFYNHERIFKTYQYSDLVTPYDYGLDGWQASMVILQNIPYRMSEYEKSFVYYSVEDSNDIDPELIDGLHELYPYALEEDYIRISNLVDLDRALSMVEGELNYCGLKDNTVLMLVGYNNYTESMNAIGNETKIPANSILYLYDYGQTVKKYSKKVSSLDMIPTLSNLFGLSCDDTYIIGRDIFDPDYHGMQVTNYTTLKSFWYTDDLWYRYPEGKYNIEGNIDKAEALREIEEMKQRVRFSYYWIKYGAKYLAEQQS